MTFAERLRSLRREAGLTQEALAARLYVTRAAVSKWETGKGYPAIDTLKQIADLFGCTLDELVSEDMLESGRRAERRRAKIMYFCAAGCFFAAVAFALCAFLLRNALWTIGAGLSAAGYLAFAFFARPRERRAADGWRRIAVFAAVFAVLAVVTVLGAVS